MGFKLKCFYYRVRNAILGYGFYPRKTEGWISSAKFESRVIQTENFASPSSQFDTELLLHCSDGLSVPYGKTSCKFDGDSSFLSIADTKDWEFSEEDEDFEAYMIPCCRRGGKMVFRSSIIKRDFYKLKRLSFSDYYAVSMP